MTVSSRCCCWDNSVGGWMHHPVTSDFAHSCPQLHPRSSGPRHAWWTSLSLTIQPPPHLSDSLSPSIHSVSLLQVSGCTAAGARTGPHPLQSPPCLPLMFPILCRELAAWPQLSLNGAISPWPFSPQVPRPAPHIVPSMQHGASSRWWGSNGPCAWGGCGLGGPLPQSPALWVDQSHGVCVGACLCPNSTPPCPTLGVPAPAGEGLSPVHCVLHES